MKQKKQFRTVDGKRWMIYDSSWNRSELLNIRDNDKESLRAKYPKAIFKIEGHRDEGFGDLKWELLVRLGG